MNIVRANGIPIWVTIITLLIGLLGTNLGVRALLDPTAAMGYIEGAETLGISWGGRNAGLGAALILAVLLRNANGYAVALFGSLFREISDILSMLPDGGGMLIGIGSFLLVEIVCFIISIRAALTKRLALSGA